MDIALGLGIKIWPRLFNLSLDILHLTLFSDIFCLFLIFSFHLSFIHDFLLAFSIFQFESVYENVNSEWGCKIWWSTLLILIFLLYEVRQQNWPAWLNDFISNVTQFDMVANVTNNDLVDLKYSSLIRLLFLLCFNFITNN